ncbi:MAG: hypothetical protein M9904_05225 [Chitinophagaceae bacterium]|nr:hypothetical protein [Chitinophagaceae bacterium]
MKKIGFALLALVVAAITFAFTTSPSSQEAPTATVYAFDASGNFIDSASDTMTLKSKLCPGINRVFCAEVWSAKTPDNQPAGTHITDLKKP